ncbi:MAG: preprotein translocase subunit SecA [Myxococcales bacterium]|nr:preprotein translocase subunit SecA [Myxococcales bacterium]
MIQAILKKIMGTKNDRVLKQIGPQVEQVNNLESKFKAFSDDDLKAMTGQFRERIDNGESLDSLLPEAFAVVREASTRTLQMRHYDVQLVGGIALHQGKIAEMKTGEGKTLVATLPIYLNALTKKGVHLVTVNDYLARRDAEWMGQVYNYLGLSVGVNVVGMSDTARQQAYNSDITYGQNNEFGFDYLRDNLKFRIEDYVQRKHNFAIVDEVDSILIDEARTPLIISGPAEQSSKLYYRINAIIPFLKADRDYVVDEKSMVVTLTDEGVDSVENRLEIDNLFDAENIQFLHHVNTALRGHMLYKRDQHYLIEDGKIVIVDEFTGRKMPGRRWSDGLHQSVEAKEGLKVREENQTLATITFQNYFRMYEKLAGMTGTADTEAPEFHKIYNLDVLVIPTNKPILRDDQDDFIYVNERAKFRAILDDIKESHEAGQPVLVGTASVERNEFLALKLRENNLPFQILNAKNHGNEAGIVAQAGRKGAITIATNMAGRGTDIILGGNPELLIQEELNKSPDANEEEVRSRIEADCAAARKEILESGGLRVISTERHESRRIDNQLRGRSGRQGDPGSSQFYLSLDDDLLRIFGGENLKKWMHRFKLPEDEPIYHKWVTRVIESSQQKVEGRNFDIRKSLLEYDDVMNQQRNTIYSLRKRVLEGREIHEWMLEAVPDVSYSAVDQFCPEGLLAEEWDLDGLVDHAHSEWGYELNLEGVDTGSFAAINDFLADQLVTHYEQRCRTIADQLYQLHVDEEDAKPEQYWERWVEYEQEQLLRTLDEHWKRHLQAIDQLREGVYLEAYGQRDPKMVYKKEAFEYFQSLLVIIRESVIGTLFRVEVRSDEQIERLKREREERARKLAEQQQASHADAQHLVGNTGQAQAGQPAQAAGGPGQTVRRAQRKIGRNEPCPCGSGKKFKQCCMNKTEQPQA